MEFRVEGSAKTRKFCTALMPSIIRQLGLESSRMAVCVMIDAGFGDDEGMAVDLGIEGVDCFLVVLKPSNRLRDLASALAHEMVHVKQMAKGQLKSGSRGSQIWMGRRYPKSTPYLSRPWEIEAFSKQELIMRRAIEE